MALALLKSNLQISSLDTEQTAVAKVCRLFYATKRDELVAYRPWNWNKITEQAVVVEQNPNPVWAFSYQKPSTCLFMRRILSVSTNVVGTLTFNVPSNALIEVGSLYSPYTDTQQSAISFEVAGNLVYTNQPNAMFEFSQRNISEGYWPEKFVLCMAYSLAGIVAPTLTDGDPTGTGLRCEATAKRLLDEMAAANANERMRIQPESEFTKDR